VITRISLGLVCILLSNSPAWAARAASVDTEGAELHQFSDKASLVLIKLHKGTRLVASNVPTLGFHHVRLRSSLVGWVAAKDLVLQPILMSPVSGSSMPASSSELPDLPPPTAP
jgi:hypothetical protein